MGGERKEGEKSRSRDPRIYGRMRAELPSIQATEVPRKNFGRPDAISDRGRMTREDDEHLTKGRRESGKKRRNDVGKLT
jgi:hypothetical protein